MIIPNAATLRALIQHYYLPTPADQSPATVDAQAWLIKNGLAEGRPGSDLELLRVGRVQELQLTPLGEAHVWQLLKLRLPTVESKFVGHDGKVIEP